MHACFACKRANVWPLQALLRHPRGAVLLDAAFDATRTLVGAVRTALVSQESSSEDAYGLAFSAGVWQRACVLLNVREGAGTLFTIKNSCGARHSATLLSPLLPPLPGGAMELLSYLCTTPLFYHRLMVHDPSGAAPLRLILACLALHDAPLAAPPYCRLPPPPRAAGTAPVGVAAPPGPLACFAPALPPYSTSKGKGAAELLVARSFALLIMLAGAAGRWSWGAAAACAHLAPHLKALTFTACSFLFLLAFAGLLRAVRQHGSAGMGSRDTGAPLQPKTPIFYSCWPAPAAGRRV